VTAFVKRDFLARVATVYVIKKTKIIVLMELVLPNVVIMKIQVNLSWVGLKNEYY